MNSEDNPHEGKLIINYLQKKLIEIYKLRGISLPPESLGTIEREIPCKKKHEEILLLENWLNRTQYFNIKINLLNYEDNNPIYSFTGSDRIDIGPNEKRQYKTIFHCFNESILNFKLTFTNSNDEYQYYEIKYIIIKCEILKTIELITFERLLKNYYLKIINPIDKSITYQSANYCDSDIEIEGLPKTLLPNTSDNIIIKYHPMFSSQTIDKLEIINNELGIFIYELKLKSIKSPPENVTNVFTTLGLSKKFNLSIKNSSKKLAEFSIDVDDPFYCNENKIEILPENKKIIEIIFEPFSTEKIEKYLKASSTIAGEIINPLIGTCSLPKPQGPFALTTKESLIIKFKNIFKETKIFQCTVDPTISFTTSSSSCIINSKETADIVVSFKNDNQNLSSIVNGKLIIYCTQQELCHIRWIYYLKGISL